MKSPHGDTICMGCPACQPERFPAPMVVVNFWTAGVEPKLPTGPSARQVGEWDAVAEAYRG